MRNKKEIRKDFRESVFKRDGYACKTCGFKPAGEINEELDAHHITDRNLMPNGGYVKENGISLCNRTDGCHMKAELFHISGETEWNEGFHPDDLYKLIGSSYEAAIVASERLK